MKLRANNNGKYIRHLAVNSVRGSRMRNVFTILTIVLSTSLLALLALFGRGQQIVMQDETARMQQVIFSAVPQEQVKSLQKDQRLEESLLYKKGENVQKEEYLYYLVYQEEGLGDIQTPRLTQGQYPKEQMEVCVYPEFLQMLGTEQRIGEKISLDFGDGSKEEYIVCGLMEEEPYEGIYPVLVSGAYAQSGNQLKNISYSVLANLQNASDMSQEGFKEQIWEIGDAYGIQRQSVRDNGQFTRTLMGPMQIQELMIYSCMGVFLLVISLMVIYSIFYISVTGRIRQFGQLRTIGMTKRQIQKMVRSEGIILSGAGIPIGLCIGTLAAWLLAPKGFRILDTVLIWLLIGVLEVVTVILSVRKPAKKAAEISPIEALRYTGYQAKQKKSATKKLHRTINPVSLAVLGFKRNLKKSVITMISLGLGGIFFMCGATIIGSVNQIEYSRQGQFAIGEFVIDFSREAQRVEEHGEASLKLNNPLNEQLESEIRKIDGVKEVITPKRASMEYVFRNEATMDSAAGFSREQTEEMKSVLEEGDLDYDRMVSEGEILVQGNELQKEVFGESFKIGDTVELSFYNGQKVTKSFKIAGFLDIGYKKSEGWPFFWIPDKLLKEMTGDINLTDAMIISTDEKKEKEINTKLEELVAGNTKLELSTLADRIETDKSTFEILNTMIFGLSAFIIAFSVLNLINTIITNIITRKQELAVLQSLGMSRKQISVMLQTEGLIIILVNSLITLVLGTACGWLLFYGLSNIGVDYFHYHFPGWYLVAYVIFTVLVPVAAAIVVTKRFQRESVVERMRETE